MVEAATDSESTQQRALEWAREARAFTELATRRGQFVASDKTELHYQHWSCKDNKDAVKGTVILLQGRGESDILYAHVVRNFLNRSYDVWSFDWRGQGLSGRGNVPRQKHHATHFDTCISDLCEFAQKLVKPRGPRRLVLAHSMGAGIFAKAVIENKFSNVDLAILVSPMISLRMNQVLAEWISTFFCWLGMSRLYAFGQGPWSPKQCRFEGNPLTRHPVLYWAMAKLWVGNPSYQVGGVTWGWVRAAVRLSHFLRIYGKQARDKVRALLVVTGQEDSVIRLKAAELFAGDSGGRYVEIPGARHTLLRELLPVQKALWFEIDSSLAQLEKVQVSSLPFASPAGGGGGTRRNSGSGT